ncbi:metallophosphoesterase [uncultured Desulfuromusa sp.]|uniref:metallophosphoesterase family protein n=1 Tax=uncultured Desulfuromusa sp. TaxID=219183 RepID=UPI002AA67C2E|nr:metallophosphoesterase [uncultured Desulfuromusa sp.]
MKIGVLSDTHLHSLEAGVELAQKLQNGPFADVDTILHAGDHVYPALDSCFYPIPWYGVRGNMDDTQAVLPTSRIIDFAGKKIGMVHGWGSQYGIETRVLDFFAGFDLDVIIFGHSHQPVCRHIGKVLLFNPGSPTDRRSAPYHTVGILNIGTVVTAEIVRID